MEEQRKAEIEKKTKSTHWHNYVYSMQLLFPNSYVTRHSVTIKQYSKHIKVTSLIRLVKHTVTIFQPYNIVSKSISC